MKRLEEQVAIVTGGGSGIGRAISLLFAAEGAKVVVADYNLEAAQETVGLIANTEASPTTDKPALAFKANVSTASDAEGLVNFCQQNFGKLDILVNNAGIGLPGTVLNTSEEDWDRMFSVNVKGIFQCSRFAIPTMIAGGGGNIVNMSSIVATMAVVDRAAYGATKGAVLALTKAMAADHVKDNIRVNCVCPGTIDTPWVGRMVASYPDPVEARRKMVARQPIGRMGTAEEIAEAVLYLASPQASFATGTALTVDGGFTAFKLPT